MTRIYLVLLALSACGESGPSPETPQTLQLERFSPAQHTSYDIFLAARGDVVIMGKRISRDGGVTWPPRSSASSGASRPRTRRS